MNQTEFAKLLDLDRTLIGKWIKGERKPSAKNLKKVATVLNLPISFFLDKDFSIKKDLDDNLKLRIQLLEETVSHNNREIELLRKESKEHKIEMRKIRNKLESFKMK